MDAETTKSVEEQIAEQQRRDRLVIKQDAELFQALIKHPGWPRYMALLESVGNNYHATIMTPVNNILEATKPEFAKGALTGLSLAASLPSSKIREAAELLKQPDAED